MHSIQEGTVVSDVQFGATSRPRDVRGALLERTLVLLEDNHHWWQCQQGQTFFTRPAFFLHSTGKGKIANRLKQELIEPAREHVTSAYRTYIVDGKMQTWLPYAISSITHIWNLGHIRACDLT